MKRYKVRYYVTIPGKPHATTYLFVSASSKEEAIQKTENYYTPDDIMILGAEEVGSHNEYILQAWWGWDRLSYLSCWEPDITENKMIKCLQEEHPDVYKALTGG